MLQPPDLSRVELKTLVASSDLLYKTGDEHKLLGRKLVDQA